MAQEKELINEAFRCVQEFHLRNEQIVSTLPRMVGPQHTLLRVRLHLEELGELAVCVHQNDLVGVADGLTDLFYVVIGTAVTCGIPIIDRWPEIPLGETCEAPIPFRLATLANLSKTVARLNYWLTTSNIEELGRAVQNVIEQIYAAAYTMRIPLRECFLEVHRANMSKKLGGAKDGQKYSEGGGKGPGYRPPELQPILFKMFAEAKKQATR